MINDDRANLPVAQTGFSEHGEEMGAGTISGRGQVRDTQTTPFHQ